MKNKHKYFVNQRWKNKLEHDVDEHKTYFSNVFFVTKEPDPRYMRETFHRYCCGREWLYEDRLAYVMREARGREGAYVYYARPEVPYSVRYQEKKVGRSHHQKDLKKRTNRKLRRLFKQKGEIYQHNEYRKVQEFWWELD
jgi:hypothetical protein